MRTKLKLIKRYSGGGGSSVPPPVETIPEWARPYLQNVGNATQAGYASGDLSKVAGVSTGQQKAFTTGLEGIENAGTAGASILADQNTRLQALANSGGYDTTALKDAAILDAGKRTAALGSQYGAGGVLGSARQAVAQGAQNAETTARFADIDYKQAQQNLENKLKAESGIGSNVTAASDLAAKTATGEGAIGTAQRAVDQSQLDAGWQGLQRYASTIYGNPARQQAQAQGGK